MTGFRKLPLSGIQLKIRAYLIFDGSPDEYLPTALTCHSILDLPAYSNKKIMKDKLQEALSSEGSEGLYYRSTPESEP